MSELPKQYRNTTLYDIIGRVTVGDVLVNKVFYDACYYAETEMDLPLPVRDSVPYLLTQSRDKKVYLMKLVSDSGEFVE